jgi:hypothetical protein
LRAGFGWGWDCVPGARTCDGFSRTYAFDARDGAAADTLGCTRVGHQDDFIYIAGALVGWVSEAGAEYYIQVVGDSPAEVGTYTLTFESADDIVVVPDNSGTYVPRPLPAVPVSVPMDLAASHFALVSNSVPCDTSDEIAHSGPDEIAHNGPDDIAHSGPDDIAHQNAHEGSHEISHESPVGSDLRRRFDQLRGLQSHDEPGNPKAGQQHRHVPSTPVQHWGPYVQLHRRSGPRSPGDRERPSDLPELPAELVAALLVRSGRHDGRRSAQPPGPAGRDLRCFGPGRAGIGTNHLRAGVPVHPK